ncbi:MAG: hypothetical protein LBP41_00790, partial [Holosporaceae bacterium]|nr:hypothetical protein [Holosporaceae bacterium]
MTAFVWRFLLALICCCLQMGGCGAGKQSADRSEASSSSAPSNGKDSGNSDGSDYHFFRIPSSILQEKDDVASSTKTNATATAKNAYDQVAKQLAGLHVPDDRLNDPSAINYAKFIAEEWDSLMKASLSPISGWAEEHVTPFVGDVKVVFYPFGGPDIAYAVRFFPTAQSYVLVGLEPIGNFDSIKNEVRSASLLASVEGAISYFLHHGFFVTYDMITQLSHKNTKGGLCLILLELARLGFDINSVENISINAGGLEVANESNALRCIKIIFNKAGESILRTVYYVKADLQNSRDGRVICLKKFLERAPVVTLVKSASYAMHDSAFSQIRDFILSNTRLLLQDDSGIPFHYFNSLRWEKYIFGEYTVPT